VSALADALTGLVTVRWHGQAQDLCRPLETLTVTARDSQGPGVLLYLPPRLRRDWNFLLTRDRNETLVRKILQVFDPAGIFSPGRLYAYEAAQATPPPI
jgi:hypothetical protein